MFNKVSFQEKLLFTKHLATMAAAGVPLAEALETLIPQTKSKRFETILVEINDQVVNGEQLGSALKQYPQVFGQLYISLVDIGEESGTLAKNLSYLSDQLAKDFSLRKKIKNALLYPGLVLTATVIMGGFISLFVLPKLVDFFETMQVDLPLSTEILLTAARIMKNYGIFIFGGFLAFIVGFYFFVKLPKIRFYWHKFVLKLPFIGEFIQFGQLTQMTRNLGVLLSSAVPSTQSLEVTAETMSNLKFKKDLKEVTDALTAGQSISDVLAEKKYKEIPIIVTKIVSVGEKTGNLDETFLYLGDFFEDEIDNMTKNLTTILEPILLMGIGLIVGFVALAIISPIYQLTGSIR